MGTAFGLDASFDLVPQTESRPVPKTPVRGAWDLRLVRRPQR
jgi:hypothetical protein